MRGSGLGYDVAVDDEYVVMAEWVMGTENVEAKVDDVAMRKEMWDVVISARFVSLFLATSYKRGS